MGGGRASRGGRRGARARARTGAADGPRRRTKLHVVGGVHAAAGGLNPRLFGGHLRVVVAREHHRRRPARPAVARRARRAAADHRFGVAGVADEDGALVAVVHDDRRRRAALGGVDALLGAHAGVQRLEAAGDRLGVARRLQLADAAAEHRGGARVGDRLAVVAVAVEERDDVDAAALRQVHRVLVVLVVRARARVGARRHLRGCDRAVEERRLLRRRRRCGLRCRRRLGLRLARGAAHGVRRCCCRRSAPRLCDAERPGAPRSAELATILQR